MLAVRNIRCPLRGGSALATVHPFAPRSSSVDVPVSAMTALVRDAGRAPFIDTMLEFCRASIAADFVAVFSRCSKGRPILVGTATTTAADNARRAFEGYMQHFASDVNFTLMSRAEAEAAFITYQTATEIGSSGYRRACYDRTGIADRCSYVRTVRAFPLSISVYRSRTTGVFSPRELDRIVSMMPILVAAVDRHAAVAAEGGSVVELELALRRRCPALTPREEAVAARVKAGLSARQIAAELGIAETTVISHRKSAYARMGLSGQRELMRQ
jgi:DNA-binding CsgD family transcriptional regulator